MKQTEQFGEIASYFWNISMLHDTEISLLVSYSRRIVTHVYQEYFISFVIAKKKKTKPWKKNKMDINSKMEKETVQNWRLKK